MRAAADAARVTAGAIEVVSRPAIEAPPLEWAGPPSLGHAIILAIAAACPALVKCPSVSIAAPTSCSECLLSDSI
jgi:hypothetical protein